MSISNDSVLVVSIINHVFLLFFFLEPAGWFSVSSTPQTDRKKQFYPANDMLAWGFRFHSISEGICPCDVGPFDANLLHGRHRQAYALFCAGSNYSFVLGLVGIRAAQCQDELL